MRVDSMPLQSNPEEVKCSRRLPHRMVNRLHRVLGEPSQYSPGSRSGRDMVGRDELQVSLPWPRGVSSSNRSSSTTQFLRWRWHCARGLIPLTRSFQVVNDTSRSNQRERAS